MNVHLRQDIVADKVGHAYLFWGAADVARGEAHRFGLALNCQNRQDGEACGQCRPCRLGQEGAFGDFLTLQPEGAYYKVKQIRDLIMRAALSRREGRYTVFLLEQADMMREEGANALLKTLEEPVPDTVFLLIAENRDRILATVESRCRLIHCLEELDTASSADLQKVAALCQQIAGGDHVLLFETSEKLAKEREKAVRFFTDCAALFYDEYRRLLDGAAADTSAAAAADAFTLWEMAQDALVYLEHFVNTRLVVDDFLLTVKTLNGGADYAQRSGRPL